MGQTYHIELTLHIQDESKVINFAKAQMLKEGIAESPNNIEGVLRAIFEVDDYKLIRTGNDIHLSSSFYQGYIWVDVMAACFKAMAEGLEDNSLLEIYPDENEYTYIVTDHKVTETFIEEE